MKKTLFIIAFLFCFATSQSQTIPLFFEQANEFFKNHVTPEGKVDYAKLKKSPGELVYILDNIAKIPTQFEEKNAAKAFWINVYNLQVIKSVLDNYPLKSVNDIPTFFKENNFLVGNQELTLDDVENTILREIFTDAGIHFVLCSASNGGAPLLNAAYLPENIEMLMKQKAKLYLNSKNVVMIDKGAKIVELPKIFEWYKKDFVTNYFNEIDFVNLFLEKKIDNTMKIQTYDYDWTLNQK